MFIIAFNLFPQVNFHPHHQMAVFNFFAFTVDGFIITFFYLIKLPVSYVLWELSNIQDIETTCQLILKMQIQIVDNIMYSC